MQKARFFAVLMLCLIALPRQAMSCEPRADSCEFYACKAQELQCSTDHYLWSFGKPYCESFLQSAPRYRLSTQIWLPAVRLCLQKAVGRLQTCEDIERFALQDHVDCYQVTNFCSLPFRDRTEIFWSMKSAARDPRIWKHAVRIESTCYQSIPSVELEAP